VLNTEKDITDLSEARLVLETELSGLCAQRASDQDLENLENLVVQMNAAKQQDGVEFRQPDLAFHLAVGMASKNQILGRTAEAHSRRTAGVDQQEFALACRHGACLPAAPDDPGSFAAAESAPGADGHAQPFAHLPTRLQGGVSDAAVVCGSAAAEEFGFAAAVSRNGPLEPGEELHR
jgi:hypothetical protein